MEQVKIAHSDLTVGRIGLGCMGMSAFYTSSENEADVEKSSLETIAAALEGGCNFLDTAEIYGHGKNEKLVGKAIQGNREKYVIATKFGFLFGENDNVIGISSKPETIRNMVENSLKYLQTDYIDILYQHRVDPNTDIETVVQTVSELIKEGKVKGIGLSECSAETIKRAHKIAPISCVQVEYSLWSRDIEENGILQTCKDLGITLVAYSPIGRGFLSGEIKSREDLLAGDWRLSNPRFSEENFPKNLELVEKVSEIAKSKGVTPSQLALAWVLHQGENIIPIPGTKRVKYLKENLEAINIKISPEEMEKLNALSNITVGTRYDEGGMKMVNI